MKQTSHRNDSTGAGRAAAESAGQALAVKLAPEIKPNALGAPRLELRPGRDGPRFSARFMEAEDFAAASPFDDPVAAYDDTEEDEFAEEDTEFGDDEDEEEEDEFDDEDEDDDEEDDDFDDDDDEEEDDEFDEDEEDEFDDEEDEFDDED